MVRDQILKARKFRREDLLSEQDREKKNPGLVLNITYHPKFSHLKSILSNIHILLTPDKEHHKVFGNIPIIGFRKGKSLKDLLVRAKLPLLKSGKGESSGCARKRCGVCQFLPKTETFKDKNGKEFKINTGPLNCDSKNVVYLITCKTCGMQYVGSASTPFRLRFNNYKCCYRKHSSGVSVPQSTFHAHFNPENHKGMQDWEFNLIDQATDLASVRRREAFWQHTLGTFSRNGLNEKDVALDYG